jgi:hypothetical protein
MKPRTTSIVSRDGRTITIEPKVYQDHIDILRRLNAPDELIKITEGVASRHGVVVRTEKK